MTHDAETAADGRLQEEPRWLRNSVLMRPEEVQFLGRAGPIDLWLDTVDPLISFFVVHSTGSNWARDAERIIQRARKERVHLTLHDECTIHALCEAHNPTDNTNLTTTETDND